MLTKSPYGPDIPKMYGDLSQHRALGGLVGAIDISCFLPVDSFHQRVTQMMEGIGNLTPSSSDGRVFYPGEPELICRAERLANGIPLGLGVVEELNHCALLYEESPLTVGDSKSTPSNGKEH